MEILQVIARKMKGTSKRIFLDEHMKILDSKLTSEILESFTKIFSKSNFVVLTKAESSRKSIR